MPPLSIHPHVSAVTEEELYLLNRFYKRNGHKGKADSKDKAYWLITDEKIAAAVRFTPTAEGTLLRGLWVDCNIRRQGLGGLLLKACSSYWKQQACYCFPYQHLQEFYAKAGFTPADESTPPQYQSQLIRYQQRGEELILMQYQLP
ncbi:GNAT family N-acetyltransferase [Pontibacterium sp. N1Y112]|uniref:GNAT family N-acetyltransferase n=1 Tax=Pontibacterium sinense TaxID=2781979 RepID=A0A8J7FCP2_9GAMM|nr:GNAT family N-acetyltransferase [Pontibacterium sinense]MBE9397266.1 GNAT family N-acetyltransferase [Pontibacterium sinense]